MEWQDRHPNDVVSSRKADENCPKGVREPVSIADVGDDAVADRSAITMMTTDTRPGLPAPELQTLEKRDIKRGLIEERCKGFNGR